MMPRSSLTSLSSNEYFPVVMAILTSDSEIGCTVAGVVLGDVVLTVTSPSIAGADVVEVPKAINGVVQQAPWIQVPPRAIQMESFKNIQQPSKNGWPYPAGTAQYVHRRSDSVKGYQIPCLATAKSSPMMIFKVLHVRSVLPTLRCYIHLSPTRDHTR